MPQENRKVAFLIYPMFSNYEISLTLATLNMFEKQVIVFAKEKKPVQCEEGLKIIPDKTLDEFQINEFDCILLSGIGGNPDSVIYLDSSKSILLNYIQNFTVSVKMAYK